MKKLIVYLLVGLMLISAFGCTPTENVTEEEIENEEANPSDEEAAAAEIEITYTGEPDTVTEAKPSRIMVVSTCVTEPGFDEDYYNALSAKVVAAVDGAVSEGSMNTQDGIYSYFVSDKENADYEQMANDIIEVLLGDEDYMRDYDFRVEIYRTRPLFRNDANTIQQIFFDLQRSDAICITAPTLNSDGTFLNGDDVKGWIKESAIMEGYENQRSEIDESTYNMAVRGSLLAYDVGYVEPAADLYYMVAKGSTSIIPAWMAHMAFNQGASKIEGLPEGALPWQVETFGPCYLRCNHTCSVLFGTKLLQNVCDVGTAEAEKQLKKADTDIFHTNTGLVYTDTDGYFRTRGIHFTNNPDGKMGWYYAVYDVPVTTESGDIFTDSNHVATGTIIMITPYMNVSTITDGTRDDLYTSDELDYAACEEYPDEKGEYHMTLFDVKTIFAEHGMEYLG